MMMENEKLMRKKFDWKAIIVIQSIALPRLFASRHSKGVYGAVHIDFLSVWNIELISIKTHENSY